MRLFATFTLAMAFSITALSLPAMAEDKEKPTKNDDDEVAKAMSKIAEAGPGVYKIKTDDKGRIKSCIVVGQSRISTVLGKAKGIETARQRAQLDAKAEFVKWLKEKVNVRQKTDDETIILLEGNEGKGGDELKESGKAVEKTSKKMESIAEGLVRGMEVLHTEVIAKDQTYTIVYGWDAKAAEATKKARSSLNDESKDGSKPKTEGVGKDGDGEKTTGSTSDDKKTPDKKLDDKKSTSSSAKKFLKD